MIDDEDVIEISEKMYGRAFATAVLIIAEIWKKTKSMQACCDSMSMYAQTFSEFSKEEFQSIIREKLTPEQYKEFFIRTGISKTKQ